MRKSDYLDRLARVGCVLCRHLGRGFHEAQIHHPREWAGAGQRASDWLAVPLCWGCHQGPNGLHGLGRKGFYARYKLAEHDLLAMTIEAEHKL